MERQYEPGVDEHDDGVGEGDGVGDGVNDCVGEGNDVEGEQTILRMALLDESAT